MGPRGSPGNSTYSQFGILEHARHRFLALADAVVNADIDELILTKNNASVFELVARSHSGYLEYPGYWIESATKSAGDKRHHFDFMCRSAAPMEMSDAKWTVAPRRCPLNSQWWVHLVSAMQSDALSSEVSFRHFRAISTNWKYPRDKIERPNEQDYVTDDELVSWMQRFRARTPLEPPPALPLPRPFVHPPSALCQHRRSLELSEPERPSRRLASTQRDNHRIERILDQELRGRQFLRRKAMQE